MSHSRSNNVGVSYIILSEKDSKDYIEHNKLRIKLKITTIKYTLQEYI